VECPVCKRPAVQDRYYFNHVQEEKIRKRRKDGATRMVYPSCLYSRALRQRDGVREKWNPKHAVVLESRVYRKIKSKARYGETISQTTARLLNA